MARLIPRKQIEEQQDISGSLNIRKNIYVGQDAFVSGNLYVSQSFFFGNDTGSYNDITGSVYLTGSLIIDGLLKTTSPSSVLSVTSSNSLLAIDTEKYSGIRARDFGANVPTLYVSSTDGNDANDGRSIQFPLRTIKRACQLATPGYDGRYGLDSSSLYNGYVIRVQAGTYLEDNPVIMPKNSTIWGSGLRITKILGKNKGEDLFWVNSGCYVAEVTVGGLRLYPDQINPTKGFGFAFQPGAFITTSPYIQNCSQISNQENSFAELYEDIPPGGGGLYVNGDVINPDSPLCSMVLDAYTQISPNGVGCLVNGRGFIQLVSFFNNFSYYAIRVNNGGHATLNNSNISFGLYGMYASGSRFISGSGGDLVSRDSIRNTWSCIVDVLHKGYPDGLPTASILNTNAGIKVTTEPQFFLSAGQTASQFDIDEVNADFTLISEIVQNGTANFPTLLAKSSNKGYGANSPFNILGANQITSSIGAGDYELNHISQSFGALLGIFANGTGSYVYSSNTSASISVTGLAPVQSAITANNIVTGSVSSSFETVISLLKNGLAKTPNVISNTSASIKITEISQFTTGESSSLEVVNSVSASFSIVYNILANGTGSSILDVPENEQVEFNITNTNSSSFSFEGLGENPTLTLFRGETYKFYVSASDAKGTNNYPFWIRTEPVAGITRDYDYNNGVINNGDSVGNITFTIPYNAPNTLYYVCEKSQNMIGVLNIVNSSATPIDLISSTLTYPATIYSSSFASEDVDVINAYDQLTNNLPLIQAETLAFVSSSWSSVYYNEASCSRDIGYIVNGVAKDLLYSGNEESIRSGLYYYLYPSQATGYEKSATLTAVKYASQLALNLIENKTLVMPDSNKEAVAQCIIDNRNFVQKETIAYLSSSWSGGDGFFYNEASCSRDIGYILDAVATDLKYGGNERSITAAEYYFLYPSKATVAGVPSTANQLEPTLNGIRFAAGLILNLIQNKSFNNPIASTQATVNLLKSNKELIQNETIQYIAVAYPQLTYNTAKCRRDVGYIIDAVATDLLYGGNERSVIAGNNYYNYPSVATSTQKKETSGAIRYTKIISDYIVQNIILDTPRVVNNDEKGIKITSLNNYTSSISGTQNESALISSSFTIVQGIIKRGLDAIPSLIAQNNGQNWGLDNPISVTNNKQYTSSLTTNADSDKISEKWNVVTSIINNGVSAIPELTASIEGLVKISNIEQITGSYATINESNNISSSFASLVKVLTNGTGSIPNYISNTIGNIKVTNINQFTGSVGSEIESEIVSSSMKVITDVITNGLGFLPTLEENTLSDIKVSYVPQYISASHSGSALDSHFISASLSIVSDIISNGSGSLTASLYHSASLNGDTKAAYEILKLNIPFIQAETIAYLSSSWSGFEYNEASCSRDIGLIVSGAAEDLIFNTNSASIVSGKYYYEYPSQATTSQLNQTLDGIKYASRLAQKVIQNTKYVYQNQQRIGAGNGLVQNKQLIQKETIAYVSSSWGGFDYNQASCSRDIGYIIDAIRTDFIYGGNERIRTAAEYYFKYPSQATGSQLRQTVEAINYASRIAQHITIGTKLVTASLNSLNASNLLSSNKKLIAEEVVAYVSSSWSNVYYKEDKCKRDVGYILDAVRTDLVYGGNERTRIASEYYFLQPSSATVPGIPSSTSQLDPTITGINYANALAQKIVLGNSFIQATSASLNLKDLLLNNKELLRNETIQYIRAFYPYLVYNEASCSRDIGFIVDGVVTDSVYGGNERSINSGYYYYKFPNKATTDSQKLETIDALNYARNYANKLVENVIVSSSKYTSNTDGNIAITNTNQYTSSLSVNKNEITKISSSFAIVTEMIESGLTVTPTIIPTTQAAIKVTNVNQITSSYTASGEQLDFITSSFGVIRDTIYYGENGLGDALVRNFDTYGFSDYIDYPRHLTSTIQITSSLNGNPSDYDNVSSSYATIIDIVKNGLDVIPDYVYNTSSSINVSGGTPYQSSITASQSDINKVGSGFNTVVQIIIEKGSILTLNSNNGIKVTNTPQLISGSGAERLQAKLVSSSFAVVSDIILNGTGSQTFVSSSATPNTNPKITEAYNLLLGNKQMIIDETIAYMSSSWSTFDYNETKCRRDLGYIIDGAAYDTLYGGNSGSYLNGLFYSLIPSQATSSQLDQTLTAIGYASGLAEKVVRNTLLTHISASQSTSASYVSLINNKQFIQNETIAYVSSSWREFDYNEAKCRRDVGYIIDAVATDLLYGGNQRSYVAGDYYFRYPSQATTSQLQPTLDGIIYAAGTSLNLIKNTTFVTSSAQNSYNVLLANRGFIQDEVVSYVNAKFPNLYYNTDKCRRDVGYIVDAVATDLLYGGNVRSVLAGEFYYLYPSQATGVQLNETLAAIDYARKVTNEVIQNGIIDIPQAEANTSYLIKVSNVSPVYLGGIDPESDIFDIVSSSIGLVTDIIQNGTGSLPTTIPYTTPSTDADVIKAYTVLRNNIPFIQAETIAYLSSSWSGFTYNEASCSRDVALIISGAAEDLIWNSNSASIQNGYYYWLVPSKANLLGNGQSAGQLGQTLDGINYASNIAIQLIIGNNFVTASDEIIEVYNTIRNNRQFVQNETIAYVSSSWSSIVYNEASCSRDVSYIIDAVSTDFLYGGNERSAIAGLYYYKFPSQATTGSQLAPTLDAINFAAGTVANLVQNVIYTTASLSVSASVQLLKQNRTFIQNETMAWLDSAWSFFNYNKVKCKRDVGYIVDGVIADLQYGGNQRSTLSGQYYYKYPSQATSTQALQTIEGIDYASRIAQKVAQNILFVTASTEVSASYDLLRNNKAFIAAETIAYVSSSWSQVVYNEASCSRDIQYIVDAAATDLLYGGQERAITAGTYYYIYPSRATNPGVPSEQNQLDPTITGVKYGGRLASKVILNPTFQYPSQSAVYGKQLLVGNKKFIQKETLAFLSSSWSTLQYNEASCSRDLGFIVDAVATDLIYGGNERSTQAGSYYYLIPSVAIQSSYTSNGKFGQKQQTADGINYASGISNKLIVQTQLIQPTARKKAAAQRLLAAKEQLKYQAISYTNGAFPYLVYNEASCSRDTGLIVDACVTDLIYGGNQRGIAAASSYYTGQFGSAKAVTNSQLLETLETNRYLRTRAEFIVANAPLETFGSLIVATGIDYSYNGAGVTFKALPPNQGGNGVANPAYYITELGGGRIYFTSGDQNGNFNIGTGLTINQSTGTLIGRTFNKSLFALVTPYSLALQI